MCSARVVRLTAVQVLPRVVRALRHGRRVPRLHIAAQPGRRVPHTARHLPRLRNSPRRSCELRNPEERRLQVAVFHLRHQEVHRHGVLLQRLGESPQPFQRPRLRKGFREVVGRGVKPAINARAAPEVLDLAVDPAGVEEGARCVPEERACAEGVCCQDLDRIAKGRQADDDTLPYPLLSAGGT
eukprot:COSAG04_NODE_6600_length_1296_cov_2.436926_1_plen_184_part_00